MQILYSQWRDFNENNVKMQQFSYHISARKHSMKKHTRQQRKDKLITPSADARPEPPYNMAERHIFVFIKNNNKTADL